MIVWPGGNHSKSVCRLNRGSLCALQFAQWASTLQTTPASESSAPIPIPVPLSREFSIHFPSLIPIQHLPVSLPSPYPGHPHPHITINKSLPSPSPSHPHATSDKSLPSPYPCPSPDHYERDSSIHMSLLTRVLHPHAIKAFTELSIAQSVADVFLLLHELKRNIACVIIQ